MNDKIAFEKVIKYLGKLLKGQTLKTASEIEEVKAIREYINGLIYK